MNKNIVIIHYNTPYLTECLVRSINLFVKDANIYIFDNSDSKPFTAQFDNVTVFDNTNGQIINFDKWLEKYPNRMKSSGKLNKWASAKHCYSVEKCMELIEDNFILLDSDVLLKKDISELFDENVGCCAEVITQPRFNVQRILPYICFINNKLCKEKDVHFFDENEMYGLYKNASGEKYDTGASFFHHMTEKELEIKSIFVNDYVVHYKAGSWAPAARKYHHYKQIRQDEWLKRNKMYWTSGVYNNYKKVAYTCITGGYDTLKDPTYITDGFDYICFTDNLELKSNVWKIMQLPEETAELSQVKKQRYVKINPHKILSDYDISIWVDGNITIKGDLNQFINMELVDDCNVYVPQHPVRNCMYDEATAVITLRKDKAENVNPQMKEYEKEGFPKKNGLLQSNILLRKHNEEDCIRLMDAWFAELKEKSHRDQLSFNYVAWKNSDIKVIYMDKKLDKSEFFLKSNGHGHGNRRIELRLKTNRTQKIKLNAAKIRKVYQTHELRTL